MTTFPLCLDLNEWKAYACLFAVGSRRISRSLFRNQLHCPGPVRLPVFAFRLFVASPNDFGPLLTYARALPAGDVPLLRGVSHAGRNR